MTAGVAVQNPFPGLRPFEAQDSTLFFGRDEQIGEALVRMLRQRLLAVVGVSGCGKSSLVGAGMIPALEMGLAGDPDERWRVAVMRPGDGPLRALLRCLGWGANDLVERTYGLLEAVQTNFSADENLLLVVDQFEEIFQFRDRKLREGAGSEAELFVSYLLRAAQDQSGRVYVLLTMRSDYLGECAKFHGLPEALNDGQYLVPRMTRQQLQEAIENPLKAAGVEIHRALVQDLLNQCDEEPDNLPLLQHLLKRTFEEWEKNGAQGPITATMAEAAGGLAEALNQDAETVYAALSAAEQQAAETLFRRITESPRADRGQEDRPVRRPQLVTELAVLARVSEAGLRVVVRRFEERGLLVLRTSDGGDKVDLPHECLCLKWLRLKNWIRAETEDAKKLRFLLDAAGTSHLTGLALSEALEWQGEGRFESEWSLRYLSGDERSRVADWIGESQLLVEKAQARERQRLEERRQQAEERSRRARITALVFAVLFLIAAGLGVYAYFQKVEADRQRANAVRSANEAKKNETDALEQKRVADQAKENIMQQSTLLDTERSEAVEQAALATSGHLASASALYFNLHLDLEALLAVQAQKIAESFETRNALLLGLALNPGLLTMLNHNSQLRTLAFSHDGKMAVGSEYGTVRLWDSASRRPLGEINPHAGAIHTVAFSPDNKVLAAPCGDQSICLWNAATLQPLGAPLRIGTGMVFSVAFSPDGTKLATASGVGARLWNVATHEQLGALACYCDIRSLAFSPDGAILAGGSWQDLVAPAGQPLSSNTPPSYTVRLWKVDSHQDAGSLNGHTAVVTSVAFSHDGKMLASASADGTVRLWDAAGLRQLGVPLQGHSGTVFSVAFSPDDKLLASGGLDKTVRFWDVAGHRQIGDSLASHREPVESVAFSYDGKTLASASDDQTVRLWDPAHPSLGDPLVGSGCGVQRVVFSRDGRKLASACPGDAQVWDLTTRQSLGALPNKSGFGDLAFSPDGATLASASGGGVLLWNATTRELLGSLPCNCGVIRRVAFSPDGKMLATAGDDHAVRLWDITGRRLLGEPLMHGASVLDVAFSPDGKFVAAAGARSDPTIRIWDVANHHQLEKPMTGHRDTIDSIAFSSNGKLLASTSSADQTVRLWDVASHQQQGDPLPGEYKVVGVAFSPDRGTLAGANLAGQGDARGTVLLWDVATRQPLGVPLTGHASYVRSVAFSPDGKWLASASDDETVRLWDMDLTHWVSRLCGIANRNLSLAEWQQYVGLNIPYRLTCPNQPPGEGAPK